MLGVHLLALPALSRALFYDVIAPHLVPPEGGCVPWSEAGDAVSALWAEGKPPANAGAFCAQQAKGSTNKTCGPPGHRDVFVNMDHGNVCPTSYCMSNRTGTLAVAFCTSALGVPEQINVQIAGPDAVVVQWITHEAAAPADPPVVRLGTASGALNSTVEGATHVHTTAGGRAYYMHFVRLTQLAPRARYFYAVQSGAAGASGSAQFSFRAPYAKGETRIALYGDMGVYSWNNMANLKSDTVDRADFDLIIHAGDHCYNEGDMDEVRADGYMQAFEQTIANVPWMPIVGNHEYYVSAELHRYLDSTFEKWGPIDVAGDGEAAYGGVGGGATSATSALGAFLSAGNHHAAGTTVSNKSGSVVSNSSRYFSADFGLVHLVALSLNGYNGVDNCTAECNAAQIEWLKRDLAAVDRAVTPWVVAMSHFPLYNRAVPLGEGQEQLAREWAAQDAKDAKAPWNVAEACEYPDANGVSHAKGCRPEGWDNSSWVGEPGPAEEGEVGAPPIAQPVALKELEPLFDEHGVDLYWAGHIHFYQTFDGPVRAGKVLMNGTHNPTGTVHVCTGNGGPPAPSSCRGYCGASSTRDWSGCALCLEQPYSYTRLTAHNATDLLWEQVSNADSSIIDSWVLHQDKHGAFPAPPTPPPSPVPPSTVCGRQPAPVGCNCTGTVYFGARFVSGTPGSGAENTFAQMLDSPYLTKQVAGSIPCTSQAFGSDPDGGRYKMCFCVT
jgi:hypothetical protein